MSEVGILQKEENMRMMVRRKRDSNRQRFVEVLTAAGDPVEGGKCTSTERLDIAMGLVYYLVD